MSEIPEFKNEKRPVARDAGHSHVVFLVNFLSPNLLPVFREVAQHVKRLDILVSVKMESNRNWNPDFGDLNVIVQKNWTTRRVVKHPGGYEEELFVHLPLDTFSQLRKLRPDCIVSLEMGTRSLLSSLYRHLWSRHSRHVLSVYGSERSEAGRGRMRQWLRKRLLRSADIVTFNGPSCKRYLQSMGANSDRMSPWNYAADPSKAYRGEILATLASTNNAKDASTADCFPLRFLSVSQLIPRKGILIAANILSAWAQKNTDRQIEWAIAGTGPQSDELKAIPKAANLKVELLGHQDADQLQMLYRDYPLHLFPTLGDEWGLVVDEALASGQLVLGSIHSQAVETLIENGKNGWHFDPESPSSMHAMLDTLISIAPSQLDAMRHYARQSAASRTPVASALQFVAAVNKAMEKV